MLSTLLIALFISSLGSVTALEVNDTSTLTISATFTYSWTSTITTTFSTSVTTTTAYMPTYTAIEMRAISPGSPFHLQPLNARGLTFQLGGSPITYCPPQVQENAVSCPPGNITGVNGCSLSTEVPGGQQIYLSPDGSLRYTPAHSARIPPGSVQCPLSYTPVSQSDDAMEVGVNGLNATGFMACPQLGVLISPQQWMVYANVPNVTVPLRTKISQCVPFEVAGFVVQLGNAPAAWEYL